MSDPATIWEGPAGIIPVVNTEGNIFEEVQEATAAQTVFTLLNFQYTPGTNSIFVYRKSGGIGGQMLRRAVDYIETDTSTITLTAGATAGDLLFFLSVGITTDTPPVVINGVPPAGTTGQALVKLSNSDYDMGWVSLTALSTLLDSPRVSVASASTVDLTAAPILNVTRNIQITGNVQIDGFQINNGNLFAVRFSGYLTLKNNANIVTQSGADIKVAAGDTCFIRATGGNIVEVIAYCKAQSSDVDAEIQEFRLSLTTGVPVTVTDVTGASTIYMVPYKGNKIALYVNNNWVIHTTPQISVALAGLIVGRPYDVFCYSNAGVPTLEILAWTSDTARATALAVQDGVYVKTGDVTRKYIGSFRTTAANTTEDSARRRLLWNYYNRVDRFLLRREAAVSWNYTSIVLRQANANALNQVEILNGVQEDCVSIELLTSFSDTVSTTNYTIIGENSLAIAADCTIGYVTPQAAAQQAGKARINKIPGLGYTYYAWLEGLSAAVGIATWYGTSSSGLHGNWKA